MEIVPIDRLPQSTKVDVNALSRLFRATTTSYKFLFFHAILNLLPAGNTILLKEIAKEMVAIAWYPISFCKLSFGLVDMTASIIERLEFPVKSTRLGSPILSTRLREAIAYQADELKIYRLLEYVPYRLLAPFFAGHYSGVADTNKDNLTRKLSSDYFNTIKPLYCFGSDGTVMIHEHWSTYLKQNLNIVRGWAYWKFIQYLQARNPNVIAISSKLIPPLKRAPLLNQISYWKMIIENAEIRCIYSGKILKYDSFELDHFIPWSFVCHDQLWNLVPVIPNVNSSKGNSLPATDYIDAFIQIQSEGLKLSKEFDSNRSWVKVVEPFVSDLHISYEDLLDHKKVKQAYLSTIPSVLSLATQNGFAPEWRYTAF